MNDKIPTNWLGIVMLFGAWGLLLGLLTFLFHNWYSHQENPNQQVQGLVLPDGSRQIVLHSNFQHQYIATGTINGVEINFLFDTGATSVVIPQHIARKAGLKKGRKIQAETANGIAVVHLTRIDEIQIGNIRINNISASISPGLQGDYALLGMSALRHFRLEHSEDRLIITLPSD